MEHVRSLRESVTAEDIADGIILSHKGSKETLEKTIVLVEGKDDVDVYNSFLDENMVDFHSHDGCSKVSEVHRYMMKTHKSPFISILDSDFIRLSGKKLKHPKNMFYTDFHDSEMLMVNSLGLMRAVFFSVVPHDKEYVELKDRITNELHVLSLARWYVMKNKIGWEYCGLDLSSLSWGATIPIDEVIKGFRPGKNPKGNLNKANIEKFVSEHDDVDKRQTTNGHDFVSRMAAIFKKEYSCQLSDNALRKKMCESFGLKRAKTMQLYNEIKAWCDDNSLSSLIKT